MVPLECNVILAGKFGVGKTCIFQRLRSGRVPEGVTRGITASSNWGDDDGGLDSCVLEREIAGKKIKVTLWDTGSQERYDSMTANYYRNAHGVIFIYSVDDENTLFALNDWAMEAKQLSRQREHLVMCLWGSKSDLPHKVKDDAVNSFISHHNIPKELESKVNVLDDSVEKALMALFEYMHHHFVKEEPVQHNILQLYETEPSPQPTFQEKVQNCCRLNS